VICQAADGGGQTRTVATIENLVDLGPITPDGKEMILEARAAGTSIQDIVVVTLDGTKATRTLWQSASTENEPNLSPDGKWLAYESDESGLTEVYVRPYPDVTRGRWQISNSGGVMPLWSRTGRELYFLDSAGTVGASTASDLMSVPVTAGAEFVMGTPVRVATFPAVAAQDYEVGTDGRFLVKIPAASDGATPRQSVVVVQNWFDELRARVPVPR